MIQVWTLLAALLIHTLASAADVTSNRNATNSTNPDSGIALLQRVAQQAMNLSYSGVFVYRSGGREETSRIAHASTDGREVERIEVLDGSAREVMRNGAEVKCFLPEENRVIVERRPNFRGFPALMPVSFADLAQNYAVRAGGAGRVADTACQSLTLDPRDALRYGHQLWIEPNSGLLLKASLVNRQGQVLESFAFTQVSIGSNFVRQQLIPSAESQLGRVEKVQSSELRAGDVKWAIENLPAGFRVSKVMLRKLANVPSAQDVVHFVISDGLAAVSVFIEASAANKPNEIGQPSGAMSFYSRQIGAHRAIVMGEVPLVTAKLIGDAIERREK